MNARKDPLVREASQAFALAGAPTACAPYGNGHINDTYLLETAQRRYILQRVNARVFPKPLLVMSNIIQVTAYLRAIIKARGGDPDRETLTLVDSKQGKPYYVDADGEVWRVYLFVEDTISCEKAETEALFACAGESFGNFQRLLCDYHATGLEDTIPNFHNTVMRMEQLKKAAAENAAGRLEKARAELDFALAREKEAGALVEAGLPTRVTHNDTKLNNILMDAKTGRGLCVIDLDTVMPGLAAYDAGDAIRSGATSAAEDEEDLSLVHMRLPMYKAFMEAFIRGTGGALTKEEVRSLAVGAKLMTFECGTRFLADYLNGDVYFRVHRPEHNLARARNQFKLVADMERKADDMRAIIEGLL